MQNLEQIFQLQKQWAWNSRLASLEERKGLLENLKLAVLRYENEICEALKTDFQKPEAETLLSEVFPVLSEIHTTLKNLKRWSRPKKVYSGIMLLGTRNHIHREARGTILIISPWNYPFSLALVPLISAIAAGNTVILKPSELTPNTSALLEKILKEIFEPRLVSTLQGGVEVATELLKLPFDHIFFTGSTNVGKVIMSAAAKNLSSLTLELGGKSPVIVHSSCDIQSAAESIVWGKLINAGQTCVAPDYVYVEAKILGHFKQALQKVLERRQTSLGGASIITETHAHRLRELTVEALKDGAKSLTATQSLEPRRLSLTLLENPTSQSRLMKEEIFGPILPLLAFNDLQEVIGFIQARPKPLALYLFAKNQDVIDEVLKKTSAGGVCINDTLIHLGNHNLPFGGVGESGFGNYHGEAGFKTFTHEKSVLRQGPLGRFLRFFYPPYTPYKTKILRKLIRLIT
jgi:aldehyde dehydrogenase (NAD+)